MLCFGDQNGIEPGTSRCGALGNCPIVAFARAGQTTSLKLLRDGTPSGTMVLFVCWSSEIPMLEIIDALCSYHEPTRRCLDRALTRWGNRRGPCGNGSSMRSWVRVALSGGVLPAFLPAAGLPCPPSSFSWARDATGEDGKAVHLAKWARPPSGSFTVSRAPPPMEHTLRHNVLPR
jgi:hypothetical protein